MQAPHFPTPPLMHSASVSTTLLRTSARCSTARASLTCREPDRISKSWRLLAGCLTRCRHAPPHGSKTPTTDREVKPPFRRGKIGFKILCERCRDFAKRGLNNESSDQSFCRRLYSFARLREAHAAAATCCALLQELEPDPTRGTARNLRRPAGRA